VSMFLRISPNNNQPEHMHNPSFSDRQRDADDFVTPMGSPNPIWCSRSTHNSSSQLLIPSVMEDGEFRPQPFRQPASKWATEPEIMVVRWETSRGQMRVKADEKSTCYFRAPCFFFLALKVFRENLEVPSSGSRSFSPGHTEFMRDGNPYRSTRVFRPRDAPLFSKLRQVVETLKNCICANILREGEEIAFESISQHSHHPHEHRPAEMFEPCPLPALEKKGSKS
jgi:hypothetical protein